MELENLKQSWDDANLATEKKFIDTEKILTTVKNKYKARLKKIIYSEVSGVVICLGAAVYIVFNFPKLNTLALQIAGITAILLLAAISVLSLVSLRRLIMPAAAEQPYAEAIKDFAINMIRFKQLQKANIFLSYLLLVMIIILLSKFIQGKDFSANKYFWTYAFAGGYLFLACYSKWISTFYGKSLRQAGELLKEVD